jgi:AraC-like DNA-binding protein
MENLNFCEPESLLEAFAFELNNKAGVFLCTDGSYDALVNGQLYHFTKGTLCFISPLISIHGLSKSEDFKYIYVVDDAEIFYSAIQPIINTIIRFRLLNNPCLQLNKKHIKYLISQKELIDKKLETLTTLENNEEKILVQNIIYLLMQETFLEFLSLYFHNCVKNPEPVKKNEMIAFHFLYMLHLNYKSERSVTFYANEARLTTGHFTHIIKKTTGQTPTKWIETVTIANAKLLLVKTNKTIKEISYDLNFPEQFTFHKYFKLYTGVSPKEYRLSKRK